MEGATFFGWLPSLALSGAGVATNKREIMEGCEAGVEGMKRPPQSACQLKDCEVTRTQSFQRQPVMPRTLTCYAEEAGRACAADWTRKFCAARYCGAFGKAQAPAPPDPHSRQERR